VVEELDNKHLLLLYLADELSPPQRGRLERLLASDQELRLELDRLGAAQGSLEAGLGRLDELCPLPVKADSAVRRVARDMRSRAIQLGVSSRQTAPRYNHGLRRIAFPAAVAASVLVTVMVWIDRRERAAVGPANRRQVSVVPSDSPQTTDPANVESESDFALWRDSFQTHLASATTTEGVSRDEISPFLLNANATMQD